MKSHIPGLYAGKHYARQGLFMNGAVERQLRFIRPIRLPGPLIRYTGLVVNNRFPPVGQAVHTVNLDLEADAADF